MKIIKIADREGWGCVKHFIADSLVSGTEEEKRLKKAIKDYSKAKLEHSKHRGGNFDNNKRPYSSSPFTSNRQNERSSENSNNYKSSYVYQGESLRKKMETIYCFNCKSVGHYSFHCPFPSSRDNLKIPNLEKGDGN